jgi:hypothetical protein
VKNAFLSVQIMHPEAKLNENFPNEIIMKNIALFSLLSLFVNESLQISARTVFQNYVDTKITINKRINVAHDIW